MAAIIILLHSCKTQFKNISCEHFNLCAGLQSMAELNEISRTEGHS